MRVKVLQTFRYSTDGFTVRLAWPPIIVDLPDWMVPGLEAKGRITRDLKGAVPMGVKEESGEDSGMSAVRDGGIEIASDWKKWSAVRRKALAKEIGHEVQSSDDANQVIEQYLADQKSRAAAAGQG